MLRGLLTAEGCKIGRRHVKALMKRMGIEALYRRPRTTKPEPGHKFYPYLLRGIEITRPTRYGRWTSVCRSKRRKRWGRAPCNRLAGAGCKPP
jgi:hypothetical protein